MLLLTCCKRLLQVPVELKYVSPCIAYLMSKLNTSMMIISVVAVGSTVHHDTILLLRSQDRSFKKQEVPPQWDFHAIRQLA